MSQSRSNSRAEHHRQSPSRPSTTRIFGPAGDQTENDGGSPSNISPLRHILSRHPSILSRHRSLADRDASPMSTRTAVPPSAPAPDERPLIPSALQQSSDPYATPLPMIPMIVLSITLLGEFLTANVSTPFLLFMVEGFHEFPEGADVGFATGLLVSTFFFTQFMTSLLWATVAEKYSQRLVLFVSLLGSSVTCALFGTSTTLKQAIVIRLMQGVFAGSMGVARGCVTTISDPSNEARAYAILGFCWGLGGVSGSIIGGSFESPAKKWPDVFGKFPLFANYPYLLPTSIAACVTLTGAVLSVFLGPDGGPRGGAIHLPLEKITTAAAHQTIPEEESLPSSPIASVPRKGSLYEGLRKASRTFSGVFASRVPDLTSPQPVPLSQSSSAARPFPRTSRADGYAYGYSDGRRALSFRSRLGSNMSGLSHRRGSQSVLRRRASNLTAITGEGVPRSFADSEVSFAQRLLMANENAVTNIADLWVAAAINVDNEEVFENDDAELEGPYESVFDVDGDDANDTPNPPSGVEDTLPERGKRFMGAIAPSVPSTRRGSPLRRPSTPQYQLSQSPQRRRPSTQFGASGQPTEMVSPPRRFSNAVPGIFAHPGVKTPPAVAEAQRLLNAPDSTQLEEGTADTTLTVEGKQPSLMSQLPMAIILQYGWLALHTTTHDMLFLTYVVSKYESGGLGLSAGDFSQLTALMCLAQIAFQFYLYPNIGPPRGRFSHLAMFRLGTFLFIPGYLTITLYRVLASPESGGSLLLMIPLTISTAVRYCGATFTFTSVSILLNYMTPPPIVGLANGVAQSIVSLARGFGPLLGGYIWSASVQGNPSSYYIGFVIAGVACSLAIAHSFFIR